MKRDLYLRYENLEITGFLRGLVHLCGMIYMGNQISVRIEK